MSYETEFANAADELEEPTLREMADDGDNNAQFLIGQTYLYGDADQGVEIEVDTGMTWIALAAHDGHEEAIELLYLEALKAVHARAMGDTSPDTETRAGYIDEALDYVRMHHAEIPEEEITVEMRASLAALDL